MDDEPTLTYFQKRMQEINNDPSLRVGRGASRRHVTKETDRHGNTKYYYRPHKGKRTRLPDPKIVGEREFQRAYEAAVNGVSAPSTKVRIIPNFLDKKSRLGYVYFIKMGNAVKIGFSTSVGSRLKTIQTSCPEPAEVMLVLPGSQATEQFFHEHFSKYRLSGEWFSLEGKLVAFLY